jgi:peptidoglycan hydrolase CwlO-like protein
MHFQNHIFKISNKVESLLKERNDLSSQVNALEGELEQLQAYAERQDI